MFALRGLSVLFAGLTVPATFLVARQLFGSLAGVVAAGLLATSAFLLTFAQEIRGYSLVALLVTLSSYCFLVELSAPTRTKATAYVVTSVLAFYAHFFAAFVLVGHAAYLLFVERRSALGRRWLVQYAGIGLLALPIVYLSAALRDDPIGWLDEPGWSMTRESLRTLAGGTDGLLLAYAAVVTAGVVLAVTSPQARPRLAFPFLWLVVPVVSALAISQVKPILLPKYLIVALPALAILAAGALVTLPSRPLAVGLVLLIAGLSIPALDRWYSRPPITDWKAIAGHVLTHTRDGDAIVVHPAAFAYEYYVTRARPPERIVDLSPESLARVRNPRIWLVFVGDRGLPSWVPVELRRRGYAQRGERWFSREAARDSAFGARSLSLAGDG